MDEIRRQVSRAQRRLVFQQFLVVLPWTLFGALLVAAVALAIPKIWPLGVDGQLWAYSWLGGGVGFGVVAAIGYVAWRRQRALDAALEIDRRFGLKERVSSSLSLAPDEAESVAGRALLSDAARRVTEIDVRDRFAVTLSWRGLLPLLPALAAFALLVFVDDATREPATAASRTSQQQIKKSTAELQKKIAERKKQAEAKGLKDAEALLQELQEGLDKLQNSDDVSRSKALIKLNDLAKQLEERRAQLGSGEELRKQLDKLKNIERGPAERVTSAIKEGDFQKAVDELQELNERLKKGELSEAEKEKLAEQLEQMQKKLQDLADAHEQAKQELKERIAQLEKAGDRAAAGKLQQKLNQLMQQDAQMQRMSEMAQQMGMSAEGLRNGDMQQASEQLDQVAQQLQDMQQQMEELETLDDAMQQIAMAKEAMNCSECQGGGCQFCSGQFGQIPGQMPGMGMGDGQGRGERPEDKTDTNFYESKVAAKPKPGEAVRTGVADGPNLPGRSQASVKEQVLSDLRRDADPLTNQRLSRGQREHARQYFEKFREAGQ